MRSFLVRRSKCHTIAKQLQLPVVTADRIWLKLTIGIEIEVIREKVKHHIVIFICQFVLKFYFFHTLFSNNTVITKSSATKRLFVKQILNPDVGWVRRKYKFSYNI